MIKELIKKPLRFVKNKILDERADMYLKRMQKKEHSTDKPIKVGFIVFEPESWDKLEPVYNEMTGRDAFSTYIIVIPSFDNNLKLEKKYGYEKVFFSKYENVLYAYDNEEKLIDLKSLKFDYIFYQDPYVPHYPKQMQPNRIVKYTRICYIPYGYTISDNFSDLLNSNKIFFRNVSIFFADNHSNFKTIKNLLSSSYNKGIQQIVELGYPSLDSYRKVSSNECSTTITWAPRWSYDKKVGGSHFVEYRLEFANLREKFKKIDLILRPHPMLFANMVETKKMAAHDVDEYRRILLDREIVVMDKCPISDVLSKTSILISDISSIIPSFFMTGRPVIYCKSELPVNREFKNLLEGIYVANSWNDVENYLREIISGNDYLKQKRYEIINQGEMSVHINSSKKIVDFMEQQIENN